VHAHAGREHAVRTHLRPDVFGNKNLTFAADWLADDFVEHQVFRHHARQEGCNRRLSHLLAVSPDMSRRPRHDRGGRRKGCDQSHVSRHRQADSSRHAGYQDLRSARLPMRSCAERQACSSAPCTSSPPRTSALTPRPPCGSEPVSARQPGRGAVCDRTALACRKLGAHSSCLARPEPPWSE
jgi:hypothetical protein